MRHYDLADRTRNRFTGQIDIVPSGRLDCSARRAGSGKDDYDDTYFGLQESTCRTFSLGADYHHAERLRRGRHLQPRAVYRTAAIARGRSSDAQVNDPLRDWTADSTETVHYFSIYATPPRIGRNTEARVLVRLQPRRRRTTCTRSSRAARCRRPISCRTSTTSCSSCTSTCGTGCRRTWRPRSRISTSRSASTTSPSIPASSTASSSPARWCWGMSIARTPRIRWCSACVTSGRVTRDGLCSGGVCRSR